MECLKVCEYGDMACCNIVYGSELAEVLKKKMPPNVQHIHLINSGDKDIEVT